MIKTFEDYCINESKEFDEVKFSHDCISAVSGIRRGSGLESDIANEIKMAIRQKNYTKAIEQLAELKLYLIKNGKDEYKYNIRKIERILDDVDFNDKHVVSVGPNDDLDENDDDELNKDTVKKSKFYFIKEVARKYFEDRLEKKDRDFFDIFKEQQPEKEDELRIKEIRRFLGKNFEDVDYRKLTSIESLLIEGEEYGCYYTVKDIKNICHEIESKYHKSDRIIGFLKHFLDSREDIEYKERTIEKDNFNLAISVNGKVLSSPFYYNPILGICAQTSEEMRDLIDYFKESILYKTLLDYYENIPDIDEIIEK